MIIDAWYPLCNAHTSIVACSFIDIRVATPFWVGLGYFDGDTYEWQSTNRLSFLKGYNYSFLKWESSYYP